MLSRLSTLLRLSSSSGEDDRLRWTKSLKFTGVLGAGSFGVVLKAVDKSDASESAVKIIFPEYSNDKDKTKENTKILREVNSVLGSRHKNIVTTTNFTEKALSPDDLDKIFEGIDLEGQAHNLFAIHRFRAVKLGPLDSFWIHMELCGPTLREWLMLNVGKQVDAQLHKTQKEIVMGLVEGLKYLHKDNIMHRDFKPENIYFSHGYSLPVKIGDFGQSREWNEDTSLSSQVGTSTYRAPEAEFKNYTKQADLYSLGLVSWEVVQLIGPFDRRGLFDRLVNDREESLVRGHPLIPNSKKVIIGLTRKRVEERIQGIEDVNLEMVAIIVRNSEELRRRLAEAEDGDIIELEEGEYEGPFYIKLNEITIMGQGEGTVMRNILEGETSDEPTVAIKITGHHCEVISVKVICASDQNTCGIEVVGSHTKTEDIHFEGGEACLKLKGDDNNASSLSIANSYGGVEIYGKGNKLDKIRVKEVTWNGIYIRGSNNEVDLVACENVKAGVSIGGDNNNLRNVDCHNTRTIEDSTGVFIWRGTGNLVDNLKCSGFSNYGLLLRSPSEQSMIRNSVCDIIHIQGSDQTLFNVDGGPIIRIEGSGHQLQSCKAEQCNNNGESVTLSGCNF